MKVLVSKRADSDFLKILDYISTRNPGALRLWPMNSKQSLKISRAFPSSAATVPIS
jgi:hypothetical protein